MTSTENEEHEFEKNKVLISSLIQKDGKLVSPIDISLDNTRHLSLDRLMWMNFANEPVKMKLTNTGETVIISGKWSKNRPFLKGGPLTGNYVFSQIHFHWGSDEHEGSEHTVRGISYPMEVHVVFYKTRYITQDAALKQEDGVIVVVYLVRLQERSTPALHWLANHLEKVVQPQSSAPLPLLPLSALLFPFNADYLLYWGLLVTPRCSHTMLWLVSRAAFSITVDHLNMFRKLLNSRKEPMNKNFRGASPIQGRTVFHINPSKHNKHLLLPGIIDPPDQAVVVNYSHMPPLDYEQAQKIFSKGDNTDEEKNELESHSYKIKCVESSSKTYTFCEGSQREEVEGMNQSIKYKKSSSKTALEDSSSYMSNDSPKSLRLRLLRENRLHKAKSQKRKYVITRKNLERNRRQEMEHTKKFLKTEEDLDMKLGKIIKTSYSHQSLKNIGIHGTTSERDQNNNVHCIKQEIKNQEENTFDFCQQRRGSQISSEDMRENNILIDNLKSITENDHCTEKQSKPQETLLKETSKSKAKKSRLPIRDLKSSLTQYFSNSDSNANAQKTTKSDNPTSSSSSKLNNEVRKPVTTTIPRPIGKNAGKIEENCGFHNLRYLQRRPASSPTKLSQPKK